MKKDIDEQPDEEIGTGNHQQSEKATCRLGENI